MTLSPMNALDGLELAASGVVLDNGEPPRKLAILGLPWDTSEDTLRMYFSQFGPLENAEVMKDRYTGKSRGFGFVTFLEAGAAQRALAAEHSIDGRRCEAKIALPKGEPSPPRTTRIFVARIPPSVTEAQFRAYFEAFGKLQDAYMPKDHSKQGYRGIGFVTFASPDSVEKVMAVKHWMNGHEIAIDRATPKEEPSALKSMFARLPLSSGQRRSFDNGSGIIGPGLTSVMNVGSGLSNLGPGGLESAFTQLRSLSEDRELNSIVGGRLDTVMELGPPSGGLNGTSSYGNDTSSQQALARNSPSIGLNLGLGLPNSNAAAAAAAAAATTAALQSLAKAQDNSMGMGINALPLGHATALHNLTNDLSASLLSSALNKAGAMNGLNGSSVLPDVNAAAAVQQLMAAAAVQSGRRSLDAATAAMKRMENPAIANARAGPRIFIGKLTKETSEADVKEYFMKFGYVMDVYLPKSKDNKMEHRGFGFVTFETEAAIQRVVSHGTHRLKGSTIAIDIAMPKVEEDQLLEGNLDGSAGFGNSLGMSSLGLMAQRI
eukprot:CAMPEP_0202899790 /NCGR_PEP_ID=MMETSP1392-20130828/8458_1 /ASSEMBLY_ACC=CAM_ASM_000868 /TAXON_ID=225041 /ORGANISM="Chlamydomonas chlamydogama, Strain SAG 11-48b" /LENGTH=546 /DNA_ID=CAMNT_0049586051 /DNA_START=310 /DNA_END=1950 /DNA_ORIENTATION=+